MIGAIGANGISSSEGGSLTGNGANDEDVPPPDLPPLPMPRFAKFYISPKILSNFIFVVFDMNLS